MSKISVKDRYIENIQTYARKHYPLIKTISKKMASDVESYLERGGDEYIEKISFAEQIKGSNLIGNRARFLTYTLCNELTQDISNSMKNKYTDLDISFTHNYHYECQLKFEIKDLTYEDFAKNLLKENELKQNELKQNELKQNELKQNELKSNTIINKLWMYRKL